ncbi:MAG: RNA polymerase factor sigma-54 [Clostridiales bacterium]|nr:RNA polymerase factor sigma-54 [Clostridiales bacterium]MBQ3322773.1 RNA polymerase factor sigma-54 [Bacillota bacterium]
MKLGFDLTIEQSQKLVMTPELIQAIQILQFNTQELDAFVQEQLLVNPVLEQDQSAPSNPEAETSEKEREKLDWKEFIRNGSYDDISYRGYRDKDEERSDSFERYVTNEVTLPEHLMFQYQFATVDKGCRRVGKYIIESLDENGYMTSTVEEISRATGVREEKVGEALDIIHGFDPAGVGARDLSECLQLQLAARKELTPQMEEIITHHLEDIANNRLSAVARDTGMTVLQVQEAADVIRTLEPKPGRQFASQMETKYVIPDVIVEKIDNDYVVIINESSTPHLTISSYYKGLLGKAEKDQQLSDYLSERVSSANWLIKSIEQRKQTIYNVVSAVVKYQRDFFDLGSKHLKTLTLKDIAEELGIHESTVSRSISGKYLQCPRGVFEIKYFFSAGVSDEVGEGVSSNSIKEFIKEIVEGEDRHKPYSDQAMVSILKDKGFNISRRTVAKYRDELGILSSSKRKRY